MFAPYMGLERLMSIDLTPSISYMGLERVTNLKTGEVFEFAPYMGLERVTNLKTGEVFEFAPYMGLERKLINKHI